MGGCLAPFPIPPSQSNVNRLHAKIPATSGQEHPVSEEMSRHVSVRLSIARHGRAGWKWTMLLTSEDDDACTAAAEFRSGEDGRGTWMRMIGDWDWTMVTAPEDRTYPTDEEEAHREIAQVCAHAAAQFIGHGPGESWTGAVTEAFDLAQAQTAGSC